jgi:hypothetical protein
MIESDELFAINQDIAEKFAVMIKSQYNLDLDFSTVSIRTLEEVFEKTKHASGDHRQANVIGFAAYIGQMLISIFDGFWFQDDVGFGVKLKNTSFGDNTVVYPGAWAEKRLSNGSVDSIAFKVTVLASTFTSQEDAKRFCTRDMHEADDYAAMMMLDSDSKNMMDELVLSVTIHGDNLKYVDPQNVSEKALKYLKGRIIKLYDASTTNHDVYWRTKDINNSTLKDKLKFTANEYIALLEYLQDSQLDPNGDLFKNIWSIGADSRFFERANDRQHDAALILLLKLIERKGYHHNIIDFKKILCLVDSDNEHVINHLNNMTIINDQGCFKVIKYILKYSFSDFMYTNFNIQRQIIIWLDNALGKSPQHSWEEKLSTIEAECSPQDLSNLCQRIAARDDLRYANECRWLDSTFTRFQKSARWYLNKNCLEKIN